jgi:tetratricopeptide (TPR) repeat protein
MVIIWRRKTPEQAFLYILILSYIATLLLFYVNGRYRLPVVPLLVLFAAAFLNWLYFQAMEGRKAVVAACLAAVCTLGIMAHLNLAGLHIARYKAGGLERLGLVLVSQGAYGKAGSVLDEAIRLDPENYRIYLNRGLALFFQGKEAEGEASFRKAVELENDCWEAWHGLGNIAMMQGRLEESETYYRTALERGGESEEVLYSLLQIYKKMDKKMEATGILEQLMLMYPDRIDYVLELAGFYGETGRSDKGLELLRSYAETKPGGKVDLWRVEARLLMESGAHADAETLYLKLLESVPDDHETHFRLGVFYHRQGDYQKALSHYRTAADIQPDNPLYHLNLGNIFARFGMFAEAEAEFMETLRLQPDLDLARANLDEVRKQRRARAGQTD